MSAAPLDVRIRDSVHEPGTTATPILVDESLENHPRYKVWLYLDGPDLPYVKRVTYMLHPTFPDPERVVHRTAANPRCALPIWTWGLFTVTARVEDKQGRTVELLHDLTYGDQLTDESTYSRVEGVS